MSCTHLKHVARALARDDRLYCLIDGTDNPVKERRMTQVRATNHVIKLFTVASSLQVRHTWGLIVPYEISVTHIQNISVLQAMTTVALTPFRGRLVREDVRHGKTASGVHS